VLGKLTSSVEGFFFNFRRRGDTQFLSKMVKVRVHSGDPDVENILKLGLKFERIKIAQNRLLAGFC
jgi:hypothetical protein